MSKETISVTTYVEREAITVPDAPDGGKSAIGTVPSWGKAEILTESRHRDLNFVRREIPVDKIERELLDLIDLMDRIFSQASQTSNDDPSRHEKGDPAGDKAKLLLNEVSLTVEITAEGGLSILGTGGKLAGKGGITLRFTKE